MVKKKIKYIARQPSKNKSMPTQRRGGFKLSCKVSGMQGGWGGEAGGREAGEGKRGGGESGIAESGLELGRSK